MDADHILHRAGDKKILLPQAKHLALELIVIGIEDLGDILGQHLLMHRPEIITGIKFGKVKALWRLSAPQPEQVDGVDPVTGNRRIIGNTLDQSSLEPSGPVNCPRRRCSVRYVRRNRLPPPCPLF